MGLVGAGENSLAQPWPRGAQALRSDSSPAHEELSASRRDRGARWRRCGGGLRRTPLRAASRRRSTRSQDRVPRPPPARTYGAVCSGRRGGPAPERSPTCGRTGSTVRSRLHGQCRAETLACAASSARGTPGRAPAVRASATADSVVTEGRLRAPPQGHPAERRRESTRANGHALPAALVTAAPLTPALPPVGGEGGLGISPVLPRGEGGLGISPVLPRGEGGLGISPVLPRGEGELGISPVLPQGRGRVGDLDPILGAGSGASGQRACASAISSFSRPGAVSSVSSDGPNEKRTYWRKRDAARLRRLPGFTSKNSPGTQMTFFVSAARKNPIPSESGGGRCATEPQT